MKVATTQPKFEKYESYKDSGIDFLGSIPKDWRVIRLKYLFKISKERILNNPLDYQLYSLTQKGMKKRDISGNEGQVAASYENYALIKKGDLVLNPMDLIAGFVGLQKDVGIISPAYTVLSRKNAVTKCEYYERYIQIHYYYNLFFPYGRGISYDHRWTLGTRELLNWPLLSPQSTEIDSILEYLDQKTSQIDSVIQMKKKLIELLKEKRQALITHAVTKGLDPKVKMKDSGVEWIGETHEGWGVTHLMSIATEPKRKNSLGKEKNVLSLSYGRIIRRDIDTSHGLLPESFNTYQIVEPGMVVLRLTDLQNDKKSLRTGFVNERGIITSAYVGLRVEDTINKEYFHYLLHAYDLNKVFYALGGGVRQQMDYADLKHLIIPLPSRREQDEIVEYLNEKDRLVLEATTKTEKQISKLQEYKSALIYNAVTGKIKV